MEEKKDKNIEAIAKIIALTREGKLSWISIDPSEVPKKGDDDVIDSAFTTQYKGKILRLYRRKYKGPSITGQIGLFFSHSAKTTEMRWYSEIVLELISQQGHALWAFPREDILKDLLKTIGYKVSGAEDLINSLFAE